MCSPSGLLSAAWYSDDTLLGTAGNDYDILQAVGFGRGVTRPELINTNGDIDTGGAAGDRDQGIAITVDSAGNVHAVWSTNNPNLTGGTPAAPVGGDYDIFYAVKTGSSWSAPELVNTNGAIDAGDDSEPSIAVSTGGDVHVVWTSEENVGGSIGTDLDVLHSVRSGGVWSAPGLVNSGGVSDSGAFAPDDQPRIVITASDEVHVVWSSDHNVQNATNPLGNISHSILESTGWSAEAFVNGPTAQVNPTRHNTEFDLVLDQQDRLHVVWFSNTDYMSAGVDTDIFHTVFDGSAWSTPDFVNDAASDGAEDWGPATAVTPNGKIHVVWMSTLDLQGSGNGDDDLFISTLTGSTWSQPQLVSQLGASDNATTPPEFFPLAESDAPS
jgi:hypothetical protein